jgi:hypothetical protein
MAFGAFQCHGRSSSSFDAGCPAMRASTSASHACGSISLSLAVYADCRTMPNGFGAGLVSKTLSASALMRASFHSA